MIDLGGLFDTRVNTRTYTLITGGTGLKSASASVTGFDTAVFSAVNFDNAGVLTFTAVPEPAAYGAIGAGMLAAAAPVRRRRKRAPRIA